MRHVLVLGILLGLAVPVRTQQPPEVRCPPGMVASSEPGGVVTCKGTTTTPPPVNTVTVTNANANPSSGAAGSAFTLNWTQQGTGNPASIVINPGGIKPAVTARSQAMKAPAATTMYTVEYNTGLATVSRQNVTFTVTGGGPVVPPIEPPVTGGPIWGAVTALELGECTAVQHDVFTVLDPDGFRYRLWHDQRDPSGCFYGHEHGDDPALQEHPEVRKRFDGRMGYAARRHPMPNEPNGHAEAHHGYKVAVANLGEMNDEGRINQTATTSMVHMGTAAPPRFPTAKHSVSIADWHQNGIHHSSIHTLFDTGTTGNPVVPECSGVKGERASPPTKDGLILGQACKVDSAYEIWSMVATIRRANGELLFQKFATPASFDPITVHNPANPTEVVYAWDKRVDAHKNFTYNDWSGFRGCARERYAQVGYHFNGGDPSEDYLIDVRTNTVVTTAGPNTMRLIVGRSNTGGQPPFSSNILQFKKRKDHCDHRAKLSLSN